MGFNTLIDIMRVSVGNFTLSVSLNPGETGLQTVSIAGKKTGGILTAGEWNRTLEQRDVLHSFMGHKIEHCLVNTFDAFLLLK